MISTTLEQTIHDYVLEQSKGLVEPIEAQSDEKWDGLKKLGSELWLDTGDIDGASQIWISQFSGLTTNNTLLNAEIQKGIYDALIPQANAILGDLDEKQRIIEIAFILNALHGLKLVERFGQKVSVELHTDLAHDIDTTVAYALRFHAVCPDRFIIKVPLTPSGLIATREIRKKNIPVNFTLGFSARQNYVAAAFAHPSYVNVFLGRLNAYFADNSLGDGEYVGEKATVASQHAMTHLSQETGQVTRQIAASMRNEQQIIDLAGVDVYTIPVKVAYAGFDILTGNEERKIDTDYPIALAPGIDADDIHMNLLWDVFDSVREFSRIINDNEPASGGELVKYAYENHLQDLFPQISAQEAQTIKADGKIPLHSKWQARIKNETLAIDSLINLAALASFETDQAALDERIRKLIS